MKSPKEIYLERLRLSIRYYELLKKIKENNDESKRLKNKCKHEIILVFDDHILYKVGKIYYCCCPACGLKKEIFPTLDKVYNYFKNSNIIDLTMYEVANNTNLINYIFENYDYFYNEHRSSDELTDSIIKKTKIKSYKKEQ